MVAVATANTRLTSLCPVFIRRLTAGGWLRMVCLSSEPRKLQLLPSLRRRGPAGIRIRHGPDDSVSLSVLGPDGSPVHGP
jgi:hypothetical protein